MRELNVKVWLGGSGEPLFAARSALMFDLDGTLVDSSADITTTLRRMFAEEGLPEPDRSEVVRWVGDGAAVLLERAYSSRGREVPASAMERYKTHHDACCLDETRPYEGISELLKALSDCKLAVVTNKPTAFAEKVVTGVGLRDLVQEVVGPELAPARKPSGEHCLAALRLLGAEPGDAVMVGDGTTDLVAGREAGLATVGVLWGFRERAELAAEAPDALAGDVTGLRRLLGA